MKMISCKPDRYESELYLTFDIDWALDCVTDYLFSILEEYDVTGTFFMTHATERAEMYARRVELGIHPSFLPLMNRPQAADACSIDSVIRNLKRIYPDAVSLRSHALMSGGFLAKPMADNGILFESNTLVPYTSGSILYPHVQAGITYVPFLFEDDVYLGNRGSLFANTWSVNDILDCNGVKVVSFHPIYVYMNAADLKGYASIKQHFHDIATIQAAKRDAKEEGVAKLLVQLIREAKQRGFRFGRICEVNLQNA